PATPWRQRGRGRHEPLAPDACGRADAGARGAAGGAGRLRRRVRHARRGAEAGPAHAAERGAARAVRGSAARRRGPEAVQLRARIGRAAGRRHAAERQPARHPHRDRRLRVHGRRLRRQPQQGRAGVPPARDRGASAHDRLRRAADRAARRRDAARTRGGRPRAERRAHARALGPRGVPPRERPHRERARAGAAVPRGRRRAAGRPGGPRHHHRQRARAVLLHARAPGHAHHAAARAPDRVLDRRQRPCAAAPLRARQRGSAGGHPAGGRGRPHPARSRGRRLRRRSRRRRWHGRGRARGARRPRRRGGAMTPRRHDLARPTAAARAPLAWALTALLLLPVALATTYLERTPEEMALAAAQVFVGTVATVTVTDEGGTPWTEVTFTDLEWVANELADDEDDGDAAPSSVTLRFLGGALPSGERLTVSGLPRYVEGQRVLLFAYDAPGAASPVVGVRQGSWT